MFTSRRARKKRDKGGRERSDARHAKKKRRPDVSSSADSASDGSTSSGTDSSTSTSSAAGAEHVRRRTRQERVDWDLLNSAWPLEDRPKQLQKRSILGPGSKWDLDRIMRYKKVRV